MLDTVQSLVTIFLGIFMEALPFLLIGVLTSAALHVFVSDELVTRFTPRRALPAAIFGAVLGMGFPVCECGSVPTSRSLIQKGAPVATGLAFMLAAPVINPVVVISTYVAFGSWSMVAWRIGLTLVIAVTVALVFSAHPNPAAILTPASLPTRPYPIIAGAAGAPYDPTRAVDHDHLSAPFPHREGDQGVRSNHAGFDWREKLKALMVHSGEEFFEMGKYLVIGALISAALQTFVPQSTLLGIGRGPIVSVLVMIALATVLSVCSTVDAFVALGFAGTFTTGSILAFLVFGPMIDIKSVLMFSTVYRRWALGLIVLLVFQLSLLAGIAINLNMP